METKSITFDSMPSALAELNRKVDLVLACVNQQPAEEDRLMTIEELCKYLPEHPARQTVYGWVNYRLIPYVKHGKRLYFRKSQTDSWVNNGRKIK